MKITAVLLLTASLHVAATGHSQRVTLSEKNASLEKVFRSIHKQTGFQFVYNDETMKGAAPVTVQVTNATVEEALKACFAGQPFTYSIENNAIVVKSKPVTVIPATDPESLPPPLTVKGRVVNESGEGVAATVLVKGTQNGTTTDANGYFTLNNVDENATLVITGVSVETMEVKVNGKTDLGNIMVKTKVAEGNEVIVKTNYWEVKQRENTGNITKVTAATIEKQPIANPLQALQGRVTGMVIQQTTGVPGGAFNVQIRGQNSLRASANNPLYVVDGVPYTSETLGFISGQITGLGNPLSNINPNDIESIEILKDADATAIYGSRGANGVVLITTKKGKAGKTKVDLNYYQGVGKVPKMLKLLNTQQYLEMRREAFTNDGLTPGLTDYDLNGTWDTTRYTDWQKVLIGGTANVTNLQTSVSWGNSNTAFLIGGGYYRETTVFPGDFSDQKYSAHFNITHTSTNRKFNILLSGSYLNDNNNLLYDDFTTTAIKLSPVAPALYDSEGNLNWQNSTWDNPLAAEMRKFKSRTNNLIGNSVISYSILDGLKVKANLGYTQTQVDEHHIAPVMSLKPTARATFFGTSTYWKNSINSWIVEPQVEYERKVGNGKLRALAGTTFQQNTAEGQVLTGSGFASDALLYNIQSATSVTVSNNINKRYRYNAVYGRINYELGQKYFINLTGRRDGSSRFGPGKQFGNFGAVGTAWIFSKEKFVSNNLGFLSFGKLRASYGTSGNDQINDYGYLDLWNSTQFTYDGGQGLYANNLFNPDFRWEENRKFEVALELGFLKDRISFVANYYRNRSSNQLVGFALPSTTGFSSVQANFPATVQNTGLEFELSTINFQSEDFNWVSSVNLTFPKNKLISYSGIETSSYRTIYSVGKPLSIVYAYEFTGVDPATGVYTFKDVNGNGSLSTATDRQFLKKIAQEFYGGFQNTLKYKRFEFDIFFQFVKQTGRNYLRHISTAPGGLSNQPSIVMERWRKPGDIANTQKFTTSKTSTLARTAFDNVYFNGDNTIGDASFIRFKNLSVSYNLPPTWIKKAGMQNVRIYMQGQNLFTITNYIGLDPESQSNRLPPLRMLTVGAQLTF